MIRIRFSIEQERKEYRLAIYACDAASKARPNVADPYGLNAYSLLVSGGNERAEFAASKTTELSGDAYYKNLLALIHYSEQKYTFIPKELSVDSDDTFLLSLLAGAAFHNRDYDSFRRLNTKLTSLKGDDNGWGLFTDGLAAERDLNWDVALGKFKKCDADKDFIDPICEVAIVNTELRMVDFSAAKADIDVDNLLLKGRPFIMRLRQLPSPNPLVDCGLSDLLDRVNGVLLQLPGPTDSPAHTTECDRGRTFLLCCQNLTREVSNEKNATRNRAACIVDDVWPNPVRWDLDDQTGYC